MAKSKKNNRASLRSSHRKQVYVTYSYREEYDYWFATLGFKGQAILYIAEGDELNSLYEDANRILQTERQFKGEDIVHVIDRHVTSINKQAEITLFFSLKNL